MPKTQTNPNSLANLKPFEPGKSGNPLGRPKKRPLSEAYQWFLEQPVSKNDREKMLKDHGIKLPDKATNAYVVAVGLGKLAPKEHQSAKEMREATEGKATVRVELSGPDGGPIEEVYSEMTDEQLKERRKKLQALVDEDGEDD